jgi:hypothetical protein
MREHALLTFRESQIEHPSRGQPLGVGGTSRLSAAGRSNVYDEERCTGGPNSVPQSLVNKPGKRASVANLTYYVGVMVFKAPGETK